MAILTGLMRLGRDAELRYTAGGDPIANLALAYNYGKKENGKQPSQWVDAALFGKRAESLAQYLTKGTQINVILSDVHVRTYDKKDGGQGFALSAKVMDLEFASKGGDSQSKPAAKPAAKADQDAFQDDDLPF